MRWRPPQQHHLPLLVVALLVLATCCCLVESVYIYRDKEDYAYLTFTERGIIQNIVKCDPEDKSKCVVDPTVLKSPYTQALAAYAVTTIDIIKNNPTYHETAKVLIIGMGPAALGRFLHHYFPNMEIDHVEIDQQLVDQVNATLPLPVSPKFQIHVEDALRFVNKRTTTSSTPSATPDKKYDIIIHDAYDSKGPAMVLNTLPFFNGLRKLLENKSENGLLMANVWAVNLTLTREIAAKYKEVFGNLRVTGVPPAMGEQNSVFLAHSMTKRDDLVCLDNVCKSKRSKASRNKVSPICQDIGVYQTLAKSIKENKGMTLDLEQVIEGAWSHRPLSSSEDNDILC